MYRHWKAPRTLLRATSTSGTARARCLSTWPTSRNASPPDSARSHPKHAPAARSPSCLSTCRQPPPARSAPLGITVPCRSRPPKPPAHLGHGSTEVHKPLHPKAPTATSRMSSASCDLNGRSCRLSRQSPARVLTLTPAPRTRRGAARRTQHACTNVPGHSPPHVPSSTPTVAPGYRSRRHRPLAGPPRSNSLAGQRGAARERRPRLMAQPLTYSDPHPAFHPRRAAQCHHPHSPR